MRPNKTGLELIIKFVCLIITILLFQANSIANSAEEGNTIWEIYNCEKVAVGKDGTIYSVRVDEEPRKLLAINPDGSERWRADLIGIQTGEISIGDDGTIYVSTQKALHAFNPEGRQKWIFPTERGYEYNRPIAIGFDGTIYFVANRKLYAIHSNGTQKWVYPETFTDLTDDDGIGIAIGRDGTIYVSAIYLYAIHSNGTKKWRKTGSGNYYGGLAIGNDGTIYASLSGALEAVNPDGSRKWLTGSSCALTAVIDPYGYIYYPCGSSLLSVNPRNGDSSSLHDREDTSFMYSAIFIGADENIYVGVVYENYETVLLGYGGTNSSDFITSQVGVEGYIEDYAINGHGVLYYIGTDGWGGSAIYAVQTSSQGLSNSSWPMPGHDVRKTYRADKLPTDDLISANFNSSTESFSYHDDEFHNTNRPAYAKGDHTPTGGYGGTGGLHVCVGNVDYKAVLNGMSGGWSKDFYLDKDADLDFSMRYRLMTSRYDPDECANALVGIDGDIAMELALFCGRGKDGKHDTGWQMKSFNQVLSKGKHTLTVGAYNTKKTSPLEKTDAWFDDISVSVYEAFPPESNCDNGIDDDGDGDTDCADSDCADADACNGGGNGASILSTDFDAGNNGFVYQDDMFSHTRNPRYATGERTASGGYAGSGGLHLVLGNVDSKHILGMSGGWSEGFSIGTKGTYEVCLKYRMVMNRFDADECALVLVQIDNGAVEQLDRQCYRGKDTGWITTTFTQSLSAGDHTIKVGGYLNKKTAPAESAHIYFDDIAIK